MEKINLAEKFALFSNHWQPRIVGKLNGQLVKLAKIEGQFEWHSHSDEDELFLIVKGKMRLVLRDREIPLEEGEIFIVPAGVEHLPIADRECWILLFEPESTINTGDSRNEHTHVRLDWI